MTAIVRPSAYGDQPAAAARLFPAVYAELRQLAARYLFRERAAQTLQPTALVHEAYIRLAHQEAPDSANRAQFFSAAARAMRHILVEHARRRLAEKRGGRRERVVLDSELMACDDEGSSPTQTEFIARVDEALSRLAAFDSRLSKVVELRFFGGLTIEETAHVLGASTRMINRDWLMAKGWLHREMSKEC